MANAGTVTNAYGTVGMEPSYAIGSGFALGPGVPPMPPYSTGSSAGVPQPDSLDASQGAVASNKATWAANLAGAPWHSQPLFWSFALMFAGIFILGNIAHVNVRDALR